MHADDIVIDPTRVRTWCRARGVPVAAKGALPVDVLASYAADTVVITCPRHWLDREVHADMPDAGCPRCR